MRPLNYTKPAQTDLLAIDASLREKAGPAIAARQLGRIRQTANRLPAYPQLDALTNVGSYRQIPVRGTPSLFIYRILAEQVQILRVLHGPQDWQRKVS